VIALKLYSVNIPSTWFNIDHRLGNSAFKIVEGTTTKIIEVPAGYYYTIAELITRINSLINTAFGHPVIVLEEDTTNGLIIMKEDNQANNYTITFYDPAGLGAGGHFTQIGSSQNNNLGRILGFHITPDANGKIEFTLNHPSEKIYSLYPAIIPETKYLMIEIDDFNNNYLSSTLLHIVNNSTNTNISKFDKSHSAIFAFLPIKNCVASINNAAIPISSFTRGFMDQGHALKVFERKYFGPVNISKLRVRLLDDKGNVLNLNKQDWCFSLLVEQMYNHI
jgi:hypothetical protein